MTGREFCVKLLQAIESRPCLYNHNLNEYARKDITERQWLEVARQIGTTVGHCKEKWRNLRTVFGRHFKRGNTKYYLYDNMKFLGPYIRNLESANDDEQVSNDVQIVYTSPAEEEFENLEVKTEPIEVDCDGLDIKEDDLFPLGRKDDILTEKEVDPEMLPKQTEQLKRKRPEEVPQTPQSDSKRRKQEEEAKTAFLMSLLPDFYLMDNQQTRRFKKQISEVVDEILDGYETNN